MHFIRTALAILALIAIAIFSIQNLEVMEVNFLNWSVKLSKVLIIIGAYVLGMITGWGLVELIRSYVNASRKPN